MYNSHTAQSQNHKQIHKNNFDSSNQSIKVSKKQYKSNSIIKLGQYVRQRQFSRQKQIYGQIKSSQLVGQDNPKAKQIKFKTQNIHSLYHKINNQISKRRASLKNKNFDQLLKQECFMQEILKMIVSTRPGDLYGKCPLLTQTSTISTTPNVSSKYINSPLDKYDRRNINIKNNFNRQSELDEVRSRDDKILDYKSSYIKYFQQRYGSAQKLIQKHDLINESKNKESSQSIKDFRMMRPPYSSK